MKLSPACQAADACSCQGQFHRQRWHSEERTLRCYNLWGAAICQKLELLQQVARPLSPDRNTVPRLRKQ